jgi:hypothetical protein
MYVAAAMTVSLNRTISQIARDMRNALRATSHGKDTKTSDAVFCDQALLAPRC